MQIFFAAEYPAKKICIQENPDASSTNVLQALRSTLQERGIESLLFRGIAPTQCQYTMTYSASNSWDLITYLKSADFRIFKSDKLIAEASYHHGGGFDYSKFGGAESKLAPVFDALFSDFKRLPGSSSTPPIGHSKYDEIRELKKLLDERAISEQEYEREKAKLLNN